MTCPFDIEEGKLTPRAVPFGDVAPDARLVLLWDSARQTADLMSLTSRGAAGHRELEALRDVLNSVAAGTPYDEGAEALKRIEQKTKVHHASVRREVLKRAILKDVVPTAAMGTLLIVLYWVLRWAGFIDLLGEEWSYHLNIIENTVGATGWGLVGFSAALVLRTYAMARYASPDVLLKHASGSDDWRLSAAENTVLMLIALVAVLLGVSFIGGDVASSRSIAIPATAILPGIVLGLVSRKLWRTLVET